MDTLTLFPLVLFAPFLLIFVPMILQVLADERELTRLRREVEALKSQEATPWDSF